MNYTKATVEECLATVSNFAKKKCELCLDPVPEECGHEQCETCHEWMHNCAGCGNDYCECTGKEWAEGKNGTTYCSEWCAERYGNEQF